MPLVSMIGNTVIISIITAASRDSLVSIWLLLILAAVFDPWMNISGSTLANWWRRQSLGEQAAIETQEEQEIIGAETSSV